MSQRLGRCMCGNYKPEGQTFCFNCWFGVPATIAYKLMDTDPGRRAIATLEAEHFIQLKGESVHHG